MLALAQGNKLAYWFLSGTPGEDFLHPLGMIRRLSVA